MRARCRLLAVSLTAWLASAGPSAQTVVTPPAPAGSGHGPVERVAYASDEVQNDVVELYGVPVDGGAAPVRLNAALPSGGDVTSLQQVAGQRVVYIADQLTDQVFELFSVPTDGHAPAVRLNGPLVTGGDVSDFWPAQGRVVYRADETVDGRRELRRWTAAPRRSRSRQA